MSMLEVGAQAPNFILRDLENQTHTLSAGANALSLVIFFKSSCPTCHLAWKYYERLHRAYETAGLRVQGISQDDEASTRIFRAQHGATFPHLLDDGLTVSREYDPAFVPSGFLIDPYGTIVETFESWNSSKLNRLSEQVAELLGVEPRQIVSPEDDAPEGKMG